LWSSYFYSLKWKYVLSRIKAHFQMIKVYCCWSKLWCYSFTGMLVVTTPWVCCEQLATDHIMWYVWLIYPTNCMLAEEIYTIHSIPFHIWSLQYPATLLVYYMNTKVAPINNVSSFCYYNLFDFRIVMTLQWWCVETKAKTLLTKSDKLAVTHVR